MAHKNLLRLSVSVLAMAWMTTGAMAQDVSDAGPDGASFEGGAAVSGVDSGAGGVSVGDETASGDEAGGDETSGVAVDPVDDGDMVTLDDPIETFGPVEENPDVQVFDDPSIAYSSGGEVETFGGGVAVEMSGAGADVNRPLSREGGACDHQGNAKAACGDTSK